MSHPLIVSTPLMILVAGPYRSGTSDDPAKIAPTSRHDRHCAAAVSRRAPAGAGRVVRAAADRARGLERYRRRGVQRDLPSHPRRLLAKCDACLRIGGPSQGADEMVAVARALGKQVYFDLAQIPPVAGGERRSSRQLPLRRGPVEVEAPADIEATNATARCASGSASCT